MTAGTPKKSKIISSHEVPDHSRELLLALSRAAKSIQQARTAEELHSAVGREIKSLGGEVALLMVIEGGEYLSVDYLSNTPKIIRQAEKLMGLSARGYRIPFSPDCIYGKVLAGEKAMFLSSTEDATAEALPEAVRPLAGVLMQALKLRQGILAPLRADGENLGLLTLSGLFLNEDDVPAMESFAGQVAAGLQNVRLMQKLHDELAARKQAEERLQISTTTYEGIFNSITEAVYILDGNGIFLKVNSGAEKMYGYAPDYFVGRTPEFVSAPGRNDLARVSEYILQAYLGQTMEFDFWGLRKDGSIFPKDVRLTPGTYFGQKVVIAVGRDMTERQQAEDAIKQAEARYRLLAEHTTDTIWMSDMSLRTTYVSPSAAKIRGYTVEQLHELPLDQNLTPSSFQRAMELFAVEMPKVYADPTYFPVLTLELDFINRDGTIYSTESKLSIIRDADGNPVSILGESRDIAERKRAEAESQENKLRYQRLTDHAPDIIFRYNIRPVRQLVYINPAVQVITGYSPDECYADPNLMLNMVHPDDLEAMTGYINSLTPLADSLFMRWIGKDGVTRWMESRIVPILDEAGQLAAVEGITRDISERKRVEEALRASEEGFKSLYQILRMMADNMPDLVWAKDMYGCYIFANKAIVEKLLIAKDAEEPVGKTDIYFAERQRAQHPEDPNWHTFGELCVNSDAVIHASQRAQRFEEYGNVKGGFLCLDVYKAPFWDERGMMIGTVGIGRDVTHEKKLEEEHTRAQEALVKSEKQYRLLAERMADVIWILDAQTMKFKYVSPSVEKLLGYTSQDLGGLSLEKIIHPDSLEYTRTTFPDRIRRFLEGDETAATELAAVSQLRKDGLSVLTEVVSTLVQGEKGELEVTGVSRDVTQRREAENDLRRANESLETAHRELQKMFAHEQLLARTDGLTALYNRRYFFELATREFKASMRYRRPLTIILFDVDGFKQANDTFGHATGDTILLQIAQIATAQIRNVDVLARYGGDEFIILLPQTHALEAFHIAERVRNSVAVTRVAAENSPFVVTLSIGVSEILHSPQDESVEDIIRRADKAMYKVKQNGGNHTLIYAPDSAGDS